MKFDAEEQTRFPRPVVCVWCNNKHRSMFSKLDDREYESGDRNTNGDGCAASVWQVTEKSQERLAAKGVKVEIGDWMANGHYGDNWLDCTLWKWVQNFPTAAADPICNNCLGERISADDLVRIEGNFP